MKLITIVGARPQFIKAAPFSQTFRKGNKEILVHTGQHYDRNMSEVFFHELGIPEPDYNLGIGSASHGQQTGRMLEKIETIILKEDPDGVLVYGDTNSTLAGALAASKLQVPVFHVEAGLRSFDKRMPEEQNRILTDHLSDILLCPTETSVQNLKDEGIVDNVINTGDIMYDAVQRNVAISSQRYANEKWLDDLSKDDTVPRLSEGAYYLATIHRAENTDEPSKLSDIFKALEALDKPVIVPLHPRTRKILGQLEADFYNVHIIDPVGYLLMLYLTANAYMVITDSGGLQKEAYFLKTPCTTLRDQTEWVETLKNDWNVLVGVDLELIVKAATRRLDCLQHPQPLSFGSGDAAEIICKTILNGGVKS